MSAGIDPSFEFGLRGLAYARGTAVGVSVTGCEYLKLMRMSVIEQLDLDVADHESSPRVDDTNEVMVARLLAHGGLSQGEIGAHGEMRDGIRVS